jgi:exportin-2 (importin alpha re-exporter)
MIHKIIKRYRFEFKSHDLFEEIILTISQIGKLLTEDATTCIQFLFSNDKNNRDAVLYYLKMYNNIINIFYSLNAQDFPEYFEDNLSTWMNLLKGGLTYSLNIDSNDLDLLRLFIQSKKTTMKALNLYCQNYYEDFMNSHNDFIQDVWNLTGMVKCEQIYEKLNKELLDYFKFLFQYNRASGISYDQIQNLVGNLIVGEMKLTSKEIEDYDDNQVNFLKVELEEADMDSSKF